MNQINTNGNHSCMAELSDLLRPTIIPSHDIVHEINSEREERLKRMNISDQKKPKPYTPKDIIACQIGSGPIIYGESLNGDVDVVQQASDNSIYHINVTIKNVSEGPIVTKYEIVYKKTSGDSSNGANDRVIIYATQESGNWIIEGGYSGNEIPRHVFHGTDVFKAKDNVPIGYLNSSGQPKFDGTGESIGHIDPVALLAELHTSCQEGTTPDLPRLLNLQ